MIILVEIHNTRDLFDKNYNQLHPWLKDVSEEIAKLRYISLSGRHVTSTWNLGKVRLQQF